MEPNVVSKEHPQFTIFENSERISVSFWTKQLWKILKKNNLPLLSWYKSRTFLDVMLIG